MRQGEGGAGQVNRFLTPWAGRHVSFDGDGRPIFEMQADLDYWSDRFGLRRVQKGFRTNLCSTPRLPLVFLLMGGLFVAEATLHDKGYTDHDDLTREQWDEMFREAMDAPKVLEVQNDPPAWKRAAAFRAVRLGGQSSWDAPTTIWQPPVHDFNPEPMAP